jgi:hypothetical protein
MPLTRRMPYGFTQPETAGVDTTQRPFSYVAVIEEAPQSQPCFRACPPRSATAAEAVEATRTAAAAATATFLFVPTTDPFFDYHKQWLTTA